MPRVCNYNGCTQNASHARRLKATDTDYWYCEAHDPLEDDRVADQWTKGDGDGE